MEKCDISSVFKISLQKFIDIFLLTHIMSWLKWSFQLLFVCPSVGSFLHWKGKSWIYFSVFKIFWPKLLGFFLLSYRTHWLKLNYFLSVCLSVSWFICSQTNWKFGISNRLTINIHQNWWKFPSGPISQIGWNDFF